MSILLCFAIYTSTGLGDVSCERISHLEAFEAVRYCALNTTVCNTGFSKDGDVLWVAVSVATAKPKPAHGPVQRTAHML